MAWFLGSKKTEEKLVDLDRNLSSSFEHVKGDIDVLNQWITYLHGQNQERQRRINDLEGQLKYLPKTREDFKFLIDSVYNHDAIRERIKQIERRIDHIAENRSKIAEIELQTHDIPQKVRELRHEITILKQRPIAQPEPKPIPKPAPQPRVEVIREEPKEVPKPVVSRLKEKVLKRLTKHSKDYIKNLILNMIQKYNSISGHQLREIIVEEQGLCSRSSFYRLLEELEQEQGLEVVQQGKNKVYSVTGIPREHRR